MSLLNVKKTLVAIVACSWFVGLMHYVISFTTVRRFPKYNAETRAPQLSLCTSRENHQISPNLTHNSDDRWQMSFVQYLRGVYVEDYECKNPENETFAHNFTSPPNFSCKSEIQTLSPEKRNTTYRQRLRIWCSGDDAFGSSETVSLNTSLQTFDNDTSRACLRKYIEQHCYDEYPIPNIVHWVRFGNATIETFRKAVPFYSVFTILKPCLVLLHGSHPEPGPLWDAFIPFAPNLVFVPKSPQTHIQDRKIIHIANQADIARLEILEEFGGIYLDTDELILRPVDIFRASGFAAFREGKTDTISNAILFARPNHDITKRWIKNYDTYDGKNWASHSIFYVTDLVKSSSNMIQGFASVFIRFGWKLWDNLSKANCSVGDSFGAHLYAYVYPKNVDLEYIKRTNTTLGRILRYVLFNDAAVCK